MVWVGGSVGRTSNNKYSIMKNSSASTSRTLLTSGWMMLLPMAICLVSLAILMWISGGVWCAVAEISGPFRISRDIDPPRFRSTRENLRHFRGAAMLPSETEEAMFRKGVQTGLAAGSAHGGRFFTSQCHPLGNRALLADVSPPGLFTAPDDQDPAPVQDEFRRRSVLTGVAAAPSSIHLENGGEDEIELLGVDSRPATSDFLESARRSHRLRGQWTVTPAVSTAEKSKDETVGNVPSRAAILLGDSSSPVYEPWAHSLNEGTLQRSTDEAREFHRKTSLQQQQFNDIFPRGMESQSDETRLRRAVSLAMGENSGTRLSRTLLADISPPGMWPDSDDDESAFEMMPLGLGRRRLLVHRRQ